MTVKESVCHLTVADNGVGLPDGFNMKVAESLGFQLVSTLVEQIDGVMEIGSGEGTVMHIIFRAA
jgi:two-component sensor histidine kinase